MLEQAVDDAADAEGGLDDRGGECATGLLPLLVRDGHVLGPVFARALFVA